MRKLFLISSLALLAGGCTLEEGRGFAQLSAGLWSSFRGLDPGLGRTLAGGWIKTSSSYALQLSQLELTVSELRLLREGTASAAPSTVARLPVQKPHSLLGAGTRQELLSCLPSCELGAGAIDELRLVLDRLRLKGILRDDSSADRLAGKKLAVSLDWELGAPLSLKLANAGGAIAVDREQPYYLTLSVSLPVSEKLLDGIAWETLSRSADGAIPIDAKQNPTAGEAIAQSLTATTLGVTATRADD